MVNNVKLFPHPKVLVSLRKLLLFRDSFAEEFNFGL
jgi:hypothetical protein